MSRRIRVRKSNEGSITTKSPIVSINKGTFYRQYPTENNAASNPPLFPNLKFKIISDIQDQRKKTHWAVIGPSARTEFLNIIRGQHIVIPPSGRTYPLLGNKKLLKENPAWGLVENAIHYVGFNGEGSNAIGGTRGAYLSARYESLREETDWTLEQYLRGQTELNPMEGEEKGTVHDEEFLQQIIADLNLPGLLNMPVANLSNGQTRRARVAKALLKKPQLLLLDEPFMGLDPPTVESLSEYFHRLASSCSPRVVLGLRPQDNVPDWITHLAVVGYNNQIIAKGQRKVVETRLQMWSKWLSESEDGKAKKYTHLGGFLATGIADEKLVHDIGRYQPPEPSETFAWSPGGEPLIEMSGVRVQYGEKAVLGDWEQNVWDQPKAGLHWRVRRGQRWAILGPNGSGKTTLLSLITSDHPQTYALPIKVFGRSRLPEPGKPGISIFELQSRLGHSSPEIHAFFPRQLTIRQAVESSFAETFLSKPDLTWERDQTVDRVLEAFRKELGPSGNAKMSDPKLNPEMFPTPETDWKVYQKLLDSYQKADYADDILFRELTTAQQRIVLFLRALVHRPDIVILDEAFSGLTSSQRDKCLHFLEHGVEGFPGLTDEQALITVSHVKEEIPDSVRYYMRLPSEDDGGSKGLDFRLGVLQSTSALKYKRVWDRAWRATSTSDRVTTMGTDDEAPDLREFEYQAV
ncbi:hypothetical protein N7492_002625 [Penicillium capsulatum]|uniref:ABC transporter domain-containing protein n=1 Tax=Penicillium capsulatum TaxID=69766 RepID=A0A9W9ILV6_9EURO|nr:hypothetical protein N7492_002625 [Penicillium capsulatum]KAJ6122774.1 hypothetical protein N7512_005239 [Penicillium capsulatum]